MFPPGVHKKKVSSAAANELCALRAQLGRIAALAASDSAKLTDCNQSVLPQVIK